MGEQSAQFPPSETRSSRSDLDAALSGTFKACVESHLPVEFMDGREASLERLHAFRVVILADVLSLSDREVQALSAFVHAGGGLVITGECGVLDEVGGAHANPDLEDLLGVRFGELGDADYPYVQPRGALAEAVGNWPLPHYGRVRAFEDMAADMTILATRTEPVLRTDAKTFWHNNQPGPGAGSGLPMILERAVGAGRIVISAARLGNNHARLGHQGFRGVLEELVVRAAGGRPEIAIEGSHRNTEMVLRRRGDELIVHLVTGYPVSRLDVHGASQPQSVEDVASIAELTLQVGPAFSRAARVVDGVLSPLPLVNERVRLRGLDDWETIVLSG